MGIRLLFHELVLHFMIVNVQYNNTKKVMSGYMFCSVTLWRDRIVALNRLKSNHWWDNSAPWYKRKWKRKWKWTNRGRRQKSEAFQSVLSGQSPLPRHTPVTWRITVTMVTRGCHVVFVTWWTVIYRDFAGWHCTVFFFTAWSGGLLELADWSWSIEIRIDWIFVM